MGTGIFRDAAYLRNRDERDETRPITLDKRRGNLEYRDVYIPVGPDSPLGKGSLVFARIYQPHAGPDVPVILYAYGNLASVADIHESLCSGVRQLGTLVAFDLPHYGETRTDEPASEATVRAAVDEVYQYVRRHYPKNEIICWGHSVGSLVASYVAASRPREIAGLVLESALTNGASWSIPSLPKVIGEIASSVVGYDNLANLREYVHKNPHGRIVIIHARDDEIVMPWHAVVLKKEVESASPLLLLMDDGGHNLPFADTAEIIAEWIARGMFDGKMQARGHPKG
jgi:pimeloyl-ACP methyl ester carboxylesterase